ncbi:PPE domain-containing protein [Mycobacterium botniense]|uniref:PPE family protein n=1 Tax=Mycobacterium botniense TaxID=84962 RepID=A0A7I9XV20_9MYCO|nr:PPE domain-containing protein [Mycobacterium botniense]GFG73728.1 PPE family protein [Mycobacterium botniense]
MPDPLWFGPPESVAALLEGSNPSTIIANIAAWLSEAISHELSMGASMANIAATMESWIGLGGAASALKGSELNFLGLEPLAAHCLKHVAIGQAAVEANTVARSTVIPSAVCQANRDEFVADNNINPWVLGALTPRICELQGEYSEYWSQNTGAGVAYASVLNTLMAAVTSTPPPITPLGASPGIAAAPAESVAESAANTAGGLQSGPTAAVQMASQTASPMDAIGQLAQPFQQMISSVPELAKSAGDAPSQLVESASQSLSSPAQTLMGMFPSLLSQSGASAAAEPVAAVAEPVAAGGGGAAGLAGAGGSAGGVGVGYPGAGLTSFTRPASTFEPELGGRPAGLRPGGLLNAAEIRTPATTPMGGAALPVSPAAGMLGRDNADAEKDKVTHARIVVGEQPQNS